MITLYHNPRCSKSREALALLEARGISPNLRLYLQEPPSQKELKVLLTQLNLTPRELLRKNEALYKELSLNNMALSDTELINAMLEHPNLIERPIAIKGGRAIIGRPPENILALI